MIDLNELIQMEAKFAAIKYLASLSREEAAEELKLIPISSRNNLWQDLAFRYKVIEFIGYDDTLTYHGKKAKDDDNYLPPEKSGLTRRLWFKFKRIFNERN